jgi:hypothetical protein
MSDVFLLIDDARLDKRYGRPYTMDTIIRIVDENYSVMNPLTAGELRYRVDYIEETNDSDNESLFSEEIITAEPDDYIDSDNRQLTTLNIRLHQCFDALSTFRDNAIRSVVDEYLLPKVGKLPSDLIKEYLTLEKPLSRFDDTSIDQYVDFDPFNKEQVLEVKYHAMKEYGIKKVVYPTSKYEKRFADYHPVNDLRIVRIMKI